MPVIGFDMGGTSTDVSRYDGKYDHIFESTIAGISIQAPQVQCVVFFFFTSNKLFFANKLAQKILSRRILLLGRKPSLSRTGNSPTLFTVISMK